MKTWSVSMWVRARGVGDAWERVQVSGIERETAHDAIMAAIQAQMLLGREVRPTGVIASAVPKRMERSRSVR